MQPENDFIIRNGIALDPAMDGITHINVYTQGNTLVGRELSNLRHAPTVSDRLLLRPIFDGPTLLPIGAFDSIEGFWWWLSTGMTDDYFRKCSGFDARRHGSSLPRVTLDSFKHEIKYAIALKLRTHPEILEHLLNSSLPLAHYYVYGKRTPNPKIRTADRSMWVIRFLDEIRAGGEEVINKLLT